MEAFDSFDGETPEEPLLAPMHPGWVRWLPCSIELFRVVPHLDPFPAGWWDAVQSLDDMERPETQTDLWSQPVWCDPGDIEEWISTSQQDFAHLDPDLVEQQVRDAYEHSMQLRSERIQRLADMCARMEVPVPHTRRDLLEFLIAIGLYRRIEGPRSDENWVVPQLYINPLDILPLNGDESIDEATEQREDYEELCVIALRKLGGIEFGQDTTGDYTLPSDSERVRVSIDQIAEHAEIPTPVVRGVLMELQEDGHVKTGAELKSVPFTQEVDYTVASALLLDYPNDWLAPPEHR
ncbi:DUF6042 family protein [Salininema proteolyticum]|uniref:DUF6042 family protein n=1 Tax=Salininema proteolyticum TaxID=1607685 RepID=A0ABV8TTU8_9ACTN